MSWDFLWLVLHNKVAGILIETLWPIANESWE